MSGFFGGWVDSVLMRVVDIFFAFPAIILAMVVTAVLGPSLQNAVLALAVVTWPTYARVVRGLVLSAGHAEYVQSVRLLGASSARALRKDVAPNVVGPVLVLATLDIGNAVLLLAGLSFLGLGAQPPTRNGARWCPRGPRTSSRGGSGPSRDWRSSRWCWPSISSATACGTRSIRGVLG